MVICVPARNEEAMLPGLLAAIAALFADRDGLDVCLFLDDCRDGSADLLDALAPALPFRLTVARGGRDAAPNAGAARRAALALLKRAGRAVGWWSRECPALPETPTQSESSKTGSPPPPVA